MKRLGLILSVFCIFSSGCTSYLVYVNGYCEVERPIWDSASVYVAANEESSNPIFDAEVKGKIEKLLRGDGYMTSAKEELADFRLAFNVGVNTRDISSPKGTAYAGYGYPRSRYYYGGYYGYYPYVDAIYDQWLMMKLYDTGRTNPARKDNLMWFGEAVTSRYSVNIREAVDYLLVGTFEYFGEDTKKRMTVELKSGDPRIQQFIREELE